MRRMASKFLRLLVICVIALVIMLSLSNRPMICEESAAEPPANPGGINLTSGGEVVAKERPPSRLVKEVSCLAIMEGNAEEIGKAEKFMADNKRTDQSDKHLRRDVTSDCAGFRRRLESTAYATMEEQDFPLAFTILFHKDGFQAVRLFRQIYRPQNFYCLHVDAKSSVDLIETARGIAACLPNVFVPEKLETIVYAHFSRLQAEFNCMQELLVRSSTWKYLINLTGQMFPLKTNLEMVRILKTYDGSNDVEAVSGWYMAGLKNRYANKWEVVQGRLSNVKKIPYKIPPHNIKLVKGSAYGSFTHDFLRFVFNDSIVSDFIDWSRNVYSPDEVLWATVNSRWENPMFHSPGGYDAAPERKPWLSTYAAWRKKDQCAGKFVRGACVFGVGDLQRLIARRELFANKFYADFQYLATDCLEEWLVNKTLHRFPIDLEYYRNLKRMLEFKIV